MSNKEVAEKYMRAQEKAWQAGNFEALEAIEDPNVVYHILDLNLNGFEEHKQDIMTRRDSMSNLQQEAVYLTGDGDTFVISLKEKGKVEKELPGMPVPVGKNIAVDALLVARLEREKVVEVWIKGNVTIT